MAPPIVPLDVKTSPEARGRRLKSLRKMADLSRKILHEKYHIPASTIQAWEEGKSGGLTEKGAKRMIVALRKEGVFCTVEWLIKGAGQAPYLAETYGPGKEQPLVASEAEAVLLPLATLQENIAKELETFCHLSPNSVSHVVSDDGMLPFYELGDIVAGIRHTNDAMDGAIGRDCIIELNTGEIILRRLRRGSKPHRYHLQCIYLDTKVSTPLLYDQELLAVAPVIWHRHSL